MIDHLEGLIKTNNFVPHQFCSKTNVTPPGVENQGQMGQFRENEDFDQGVSNIDFRAKLMGKKLFVLIRPSK